jgi:hypothetical protein
MTDKLDTQEIRERCGAVTAAGSLPWKVRRGTSFYDPSVVDADDWLIANCAIPGRSDSRSLAIATFIAHARADIPALLDEVERLRAEVAFDATLANVDSAALDALSAENDRLRAALEAVEWERWSDDGDEYCPWCTVNKNLGHTANCQRQAALGVQR